MNELTSSANESNHQALRLEIAKLIVDALNLDIEPSAINVDEPLYGDGLGLDSIDILELSLAISKRFGLQLRADNQDNSIIFSSLSFLTNHIATHRTS